MRISNHIQNSKTVPWYLCTTLTERWAKRKVDTTAKYVWNLEVLWVANRKITIFLGCNTMQPASKISVFCKNLLPPSSSAMKCQAAPFTRPLVPSHSPSQFSLVSHTTLDSYLEGAQFESQMGTSYPDSHLLYHLPRSIQASTNTVLELCHWHHQTFSQFIRHPVIWCYIVNTANCCKKKLGPYIMWYPNSNLKMA